MARSSTFGRLTAGMVLLGVLGVVVWRTWMAVAAPQEGEDGCLAGGREPMVAILLDRSDPIPAATLAEVRALIEDVVLEAGEGTRVAIYLLGGGETVDLEEVHSGCATNKGGTVYRKLKAQELQRKLEGVLAGYGMGDRPTSPILRASRRLLDRREVQRAESVELVFVTDGLENTSDLSFFPGARAYRRPDPEKVPAVSRAPERPFRSVRLLLVEQPKYRHLQTVDLERFLIAYFEELSETTPRVSAL